MALTPVAPTLSGLTATGFTITVNSDGNPTPPATYYSFRAIVGASVLYIDSLGHFVPSKVFVPTLSLVVTGAIPNSLYSIALTAADDALGTNESAIGAPGTATTLANSPLAAPFTNVFSTTIMVNWLANFNPTGTNYEVQLSPDPSFIVGIISSGFITTLGYIFINLIPNMPYYARVRARNSVFALTGFTPLNSTTTAIGPDTVKAIRVFNLLAERGYLITWQPNQETNIVSYNVYRSSSPTDEASFEVLQNVPKTILSYIDTVPYTFGVVFYYKVTAVDDGFNESSLDLTSPVHENTFHSFEEQPFPLGLSSVDFITGETPTGLVNTVNMLYITAFAYRKKSTEVFLDGIRMDEGVDYIEGPLSQQITFTDPPDTGSTIRINYRKF